MLRSSAVLALLASGASALKSLEDISFTPDVPHRGGAVFKSDPFNQQVRIHPVAPLELAFEFLEGHESSFDRHHWTVSSQTFSKKSNIHHIYLNQKVQGVQVVNSDISIHVKDGKIIAYHANGFTHPEDVSLVDEVSYQHVIRPAEAMVSIAQFLEGEYQVPPADNDENDLVHQHYADDLEKIYTIPANGILEQDATAQLAWVEVDGGDHLELAWHTTVEVAGHTLEIDVDAHNGSILAVTDLTSTFAPDDVMREAVEAKNQLLQSSASDPQAVHNLLKRARLQRERWAALARRASQHSAKSSAGLDPHAYKAYPPPMLDPRLSPDGHPTLVKNPANAEAGGSPLGWHDQGNGQGSSGTTIGNNVYAQENWDGSSSWQNNYRPKTQDGDETYDFDVDFEKEPKEYADAAITNLFYWNNLFHDLTYAWGFDEVNGNFQENNFGNGGREGDAVQANAQDGAGYNNANMMTPADGQRPRMRMYVWTRSGSVYVDGDLDSGIVVHEYAHGVSNRLTGGPSNVRCLSGGQSGGMGEGWGDCYATTLMQDADSDPMFAWGMGEYAAGRGIRKYPYTRSMEENQHVYEDINPLNQVHAMGCVWCTIIYEVYWELIEQTPFDDDWYTGTGGNNVWANIVTEGMKLQPCTPSFMQARDAILMADEELYDGVHQCAIWRGFAKRGLGVDAQDNSSGGRNNVKNGFSVPPECQEGHGEVGIFDNTAFAK